MGGIFDEMNGGNGALRPAYGELSRWLKEVPPDVLDEPEALLSWAREAIRAGQSLSSA